MRQRSKMRLVLGTIAVLTLAGGTLTACTVSVGGGVAGIVGSLLLSALVIFGFGATTTGCDDEGTTSACLSVVTPDGRVGPCLGAPLPDAAPDAGVDAAAGDLRVGPCLSLPPPDTGTKNDVRVGPCLSLPPPDAGGKGDLRIGPCLSLPPPDLGTKNQDTRIGPCLSLPPRDASPGASLTPGGSGAPALTPAPVDERERLREKLAARLPADVRARLGRDDDGHATS